MKSLAATARVYLKSIDVSGGLADEDQRSQAWHLSLSGARRYREVGERRERERWEEEGGKEEQIKRERGGIEIGIRGGGKREKRMEKEEKRC